jgi:hypothetical protein
MKSKNSKWMRKDKVLGNLAILNPIKDSYLVKKYSNKLQLLFKNISEDI